MLRKLAFLLTFCLVSASSLADSRVGRLQNTNFVPNYQDINMVWEYVRQQVGATSDFPAPDLYAYDKQLPGNSLMAFSYPTAQNPGTLGVFVPSTTINTMGRDEPQRFTWSLGHEFTHYAMFLKKNNWQFKDKFPLNRDQHCDPEFQRITNGIADLLYQKYGSESDRQLMYSETKRACRQAPDQ